MIWRLMLVMSYVWGEVGRCLDHKPNNLFWLGVVAFCLVVSEWDVDLNFPINLINLWGCPPSSNRLTCRPAQKKIVKYLNVIFDDTTNKMIFVSLQNVITTFSRFNLPVSSRGTTLWSPIFIMIPDNNNDADALCYAQRASFSLPFSCGSEIIDHLRLGF